MIWYSPIIRIWQRLGTKEKIAWFFNIGGFIMTFFGFYEYIPKETWLIIIAIMFFLSSLFSIFQNISIRHERDNFKGMAIKERDEHSAALERIFAQKGAEIDRLKNEISATTALANNNANEAAKWEKYCRICFDEYQHETQELRQKLQGTQDELERYQNAPPDAIQHQRTAGIKANIAIPTSKRAAFLKVVKELEKKK